MKHGRILGLLVILVFGGMKTQGQSSGENLFQSTCAACHTINKGKLVGPDLSRIYDKRDQTWLVDFIRSSQKMIANGDSLAVALFQEYNQIPMPDNQLTDSDILAIISYIRTVDSSEPAIVQPQETDAGLASAVPPPDYQQQLVERGRRLFYGYEAFGNGASSCMSCHFLQDASLIGGGKLSLDLTSSYGRLGEAGVRAILANPPFPAMNVALRNKNLTEDELEAITAMLWQINEENTGKPKQSGDGFIFLVLSLILAMFFMIHLYLFYDHRKLPA
ncbi:cytochrome c [Gaoshiqia sediminis]|uniref:Cytochrome c n=1 Tax=Gaoshiqia sediminis TaxID=2986998 RepID=A0AA41Y2K5_9BACT|nr:cytochrome c [Gaoshiqia sediminis]MCW0482301.1 cytochrome c [Gaoshiqia sediminis]